MTPGGIRDPALEPDIVWTGSGGDRSATGSTP
ncbi:MAG: hypothetical protein J07HX64_02254 [halophilic archaeon J07HX64]|nr:MAG: hypothetical protein J07HX64_02254 [halophilic archaeon J07HX64]